MAFTRPKRHRQIVFTTIVFTLVALPARPAQDRFNGELRVAYHERASGKLDERVQDLSLSCQNGECSLTTLTLNECFDIGEGRRFSPAIRTTSTQEGSLTVSESNGTLVAEEKFLLGKESRRYAFTYQYVNRGSGPEPVLTGFSGVGSGYDPAHGKLVSWDYVPLRGRWPTVEPACKIMLDGVPTKEELEASGVVK